MKVSLINSALSLLKSPPISNFTEMKPVSRPLDALGGIIHKTLCWHVKAIQATYGGGLTFHRSLCGPVSKTGLPLLDSSTWMMGAPSILVHQLPVRTQRAFSWLSVTTPVTYTSRKVCVTTPVTETSRTVCVTTSVTLTPRTVCVITHRSPRQQEQSVSPLQHLDIKNSLCHYMQVT